MGKIECQKRWNAFQVADYIIHSFNTENKYYVENI